MMNTINSHLKQILPIAILFFATTMSAQVDVVHLSADDKPGQFDGLYYTLPRTVIRVGVYVEKTHNFKGPYADFAERFLGLNNVIHFNNENYSISGVKISTSHEPDSNQQYFIRLPKKKRETARMLLAFTRDGMLKNASFDQPQERRHKVPEKFEDVAQPSFIDIVSPGVIQQVDTFMRKITIDTITFEEKLFRSTFIHKTTEQKAREAADLILEIEEHRKNLLTGFHEVNYSMEAIRYMNEQLLQLQEEYLALFLGKSLTTSHYYSFTVVPELENADKPIHLAYFSPQNGIVDIPNAISEPITIIFTPGGTTEQIAKHQYSRSIEMPELKGFWYRIAEPTAIKLNKGNKTLISGSALVNQFGVVSFLPFRNIYRLTLYPETGTIETIDLR